MTKGFASPPPDSGSTATMENSKEELSELRTFSSAFAGGEEDTSLQTWTQLNDINQTDRRALREALNLGRERLREARGNVKSAWEELRKAHRGNDSSAINIAKEKVKIAQMQVNIVIEEIKLNIYKVVPALTQPDFSSQGIADKVIAKLQTKLASEQHVGQFFHDSGPPNTAIVRYGQASELVNSIAPNVSEAIKQVITQNSSKLKTTGAQNLSTAENKNTASPVSQKAKQPTNYKKLVKAAKVDLQMPPVDEIGFKKKSGTKKSSPNKGSLSLDKLDIDLSAHPSSDYVVTTKSSSETPFLSTGISILNT